MPSVHSLKLFGAAVLVLGVGACAIFEDGSRSASAETKTPVLAVVQQEAKNLPPGMEQLKAAMEKYKDPVVAVHDGYFSTLGCVKFASGTMGVHFLNPALLVANPDPMKPTLLLYEPVGEKLELVAVEWLIPLSTGVTKRPSIYGQPFDGPMEGHTPLLPAALHHWDLHAWIWKENPMGLFHAVNPNVKCPDGPYTFLEEIKMLPEPGAH